MKIFLLLSSLFVSICLYGQSDYIVTGTVKDSTGQVVIGANVWLMTANDTLRGMSNENGSFRITGIKSQAFKLRVTSLGYEVCEKTSLPGGSLDFQIVLKTGMKMLREFVVKGIVQPVTYKKDTVEYDTKGFIFSEHDMVEDLMKRLPGLEVNSDGTISMMGQKVTKIMINGQEFLVNDIKTLTSLIPANLINKIQLIDDYGDLNKMRGTTRGETQKVINLKTNESVKDIISGRISTEYGEGGLYKLYAGAFRFKDQLQYNLSMANSNIGQYIGKGNNSEMDMGVRRKFNNAFSINAGIHYDKKYSDIITKNTLETVTSLGTLNNLIQSNGDDNSDNLKLKSEWKYNFNNANKFIIHINGEIKKDLTFNKIINVQEGFQRKDQYSNSKSQIIEKSIDADFLYIHVFKNVNRNLSISLLSKLGNDVDKLNSINTFRYYQADTSLFQDSIIHQVLSRENKAYEQKVGFLYMEPITVKGNMEFRLSYDKLFSWNNYITNIEHNGKLIPIDSLSINAKYKVEQINGEINYRHKNNNLEYWVGGEFILYNLLATKILNGFSIFPVLQLDYTFSKNAFFRLLYKGNNIFPTYDQLSIIPNSSDLQNPKLGNPNLKVSNNHTLNIEFRSGKGVTNYFSNFSITTIRNNITTDVNLVEDGLGTVKQEISYLNTSRNFTVGNNNGWSSQVGKKENNLFVGAGISLSKNGQYYNSRYLDASSLSSNLKLNLNFKIGVLGTSSNFTYIYNNYFFPIGSKNFIVHTLNCNAYNHISISPNVSLEIVYSGQKTFSSVQAFNSTSFIMDSRLYFWLFDRKFFTALYLNNLWNNKSPNSQVITSNMISSTSTNNRGRYLIIKLIYDFRKLK